jgi:putative intracellular protease/amidase
MPRNVAIFVTDGVEPTPIREVLRSLGSGGIEGKFVGVPGVTEAFQHGSAQPIAVESLEQVGPAETRGVIIPESPTLAHEFQRPEVQQLFNRLIEEDLLFITWGGGVVAAMQAGWLKGRRVAGAYESIPSLLKGGVDVVEDRVVEDGSWITARSYLDLPEAIRMGFGFGAHREREPVAPRLERAAH